MSATVSSRSPCHHHLGGAVDDARALAARDDAGRQAVAAAGQARRSAPAGGRPPCTESAASSARGPVLQRSQPGGTAYERIQARRSSANDGSWSSLCVRRCRATMLRIAPTSAITGMSRRAAVWRAVEELCVRCSNSPITRVRSSRICGPPASASTNSRRPASGLSRRAPRGRAACHAQLPPSPVLRLRWLLREAACRGGAIGGEQAIFLALELLVEGRARDARARTHLGDAGVLVADLGGEVDHRLDQPLALGRLGVFVDTVSRAFGERLRRAVADFRAGCGMTIWLESLQNLSQDRLRDFTNSRALRAA